MSRRRGDNASSTYLTIGNRANQRLLQCTYSSVRYSEAGFETSAVVGNLSQSNATTGRVFGDTKSRWLFSLLGGSERRAGIIVLPPRSTFRRAHSTPTTSRRARHTQFVDSGLWNSASLPRDRALTLSDVRDRLASLRAMRRTWALWRDRLVEQHGDAKLTDLLLTLYAGAGSCSSLRTADGEWPVQRTKA